MKRFYFFLLFFFGFTFFAGAATPRYLLQCGSDLNGDRQTDIADLVLVAKYFGETNSQYDMSGDGMVDILDLVYVAKYFGEKCDEISRVLNSGFCAGKSYEEAYAYDYNGDRTVDNEDLNMLSRVFNDATVSLSGFGESAVPDPNGSGNIDIEDMTMVMRCVRPRTPLPSDFCGSVSASGGYGGAVNAGLGRAFYDYNDDSNVDRLDLEHFGQFLYKDVSHVFPLLRTNKTYDYNNDGVMNQDDLTAVVQCRALPWDTASLERVLINRGLLKYGKDYQTIIVSAVQFGNATFGWTGTYTKRPREGEPFLLAVTLKNQGITAWHSNSLTAETYAGEGTRGALEDTNTIATNFDLAAGEEKVVNIFVKATSRGLHTVRLTARQNSVAGQAGNDIVGDFALYPVTIVSSAGAYVPVEAERASGLFGSILNVFWVGL